MFSVVSGYSGGHTLNPTYNEVCSGSTGHAEVIQIEYDATKVDFISLLEVFFATHDPTTLNRRITSYNVCYTKLLREEADSLFNVVNLIKLVATSQK